MVTSAGFLWVLQLAWVVATAAHVGRQRKAEKVTGIAADMLGLSRHHAIGSTTAHRGHTSENSDLAVDAILFRTHLVDEVVLERLHELAACLQAPIKLGADHVGGSSPGGHLPAAPWELTVLFDEEAAPNFAEVLAASGFDVASTGGCHGGGSCRLLGLTLNHFTRYPNVSVPPYLSPDGKSVLPVVKSHYQQLAYTTWWELNGARRPWRFVWCLEHDAAVSGGGWRGVLDGPHLAPPHATVDFLSWQVGWWPAPSKVHRGGPSWHSSRRYGALGPAKVPLPDVAFHFGPVVRFSAKFLSFLAAQSMAGATGHSELVAPTLCNVTAWCVMGNLSTSVMGGRDGMLFAYRLAKDLSPLIFEAMAEAHPGKLFHPVRATGSASNILFDAKALLSGHQREVAVSAAERRTAKSYALCLAMNPRPLQPSYACPVGCPWHLQTTCSQVNCQAREAGTYEHMGHQHCVDLCAATGQCPWPTSTTELLAKSKAEATLLMKPAS